MSRALQIRREGNPINGFDGTGWGHMNWHTVNLIRALPHLSGVYWANYFGVTKQCISLVKNRKTWKYTKP